MNPKEESLRGEIEKIIWKHYYPDTSMNVEEILDEIMPLLKKQKEQMIERVGKMLGYRQWECGRYDEALNDVLATLNEE